jgi:hypothetical protein
MLENLITQINTAIKFFELAEYSSAVKILKKILENDSLKNNPSEQSEAFYLLMRCYCELDDQNNIHCFKSNILRQAQIDALILNSRIYYVLGLSEGYQGRTEKALKYLELGLELAIKNQNVFDILYALTGISSCRLALNELEKLEANLNKIKTILDTHYIFEIDLASTMLKAKLLVKKNCSYEALGVMHDFYNNKVNYLSLARHVAFLLDYGYLYLQNKSYEMARVYIELSCKALSESEQKRLYRIANQYLKELNLVSAKPFDFDLTLDLKRKIVFEKTIGRIEFKNKFILLELLELLANHPGKIFSKENLAQIIWQRNYDPFFDDNRIYVTIKRLREMIEPNPIQAKYILRTKNGYSFNNSIKINFLEKGA